MTSKNTYFMEFVLCAVALVMMCWVSQSFAQATGADYVLEDCQEVVHDLHERGAFNGVSPSGMLESYLRGHDKAKAFKAGRSSYKVTLLENVLHGELLENTPNAGIVSSVMHYMYYPKSSYFGKDKAVFMVEFESKRYKVVLDIHVVKYINDGDEPITSCLPPKLSKLQR
jgi:hypothetical protein